ncbi:hypothetical protein ACIGBL_22335 [Streptomyces sp. NPDC085614]|uniref:hypothetical protein n=1 Tax=Streptomyces sp. NPDC085614 TaxID=3365733 RepID=UPI0037D4FED5
MTPARRVAAVALLMTAIAGCGVRPTGVVDAGEPASGLRTGLRIYFATDSGLRGVPRLVELKELNSAVKLLTAGPNASEQSSGLVNLVEPPGTYDAVGDGDRVTLTMPGALLTAHNRLLTGQLVCSLAHAQSALHPEVRPDDVQVTLRSDAAPLGPYRCSSFLDR